MRTPSRLALHPKHGTTPCRRQGALLPRKPLSPRPNNRMPSIAAATTASLKAIRAIILATYTADRLSPRSPSAFDGTIVMATQVAQELATSTNSWAVSDDREGVGASLNVKARDNHTLFHRSRGQGWRTDPWQCSGSNQLH